MYRTISWRVRGPLRRRFSHTFCIKFNCNIRRRKIQEWLYALVHRETESYSDKVPEVVVDQVYGQLDAVLAHHPSPSSSLLCESTKVERRE